jgi:hypothetical protein
VWKPLTEIGAVLPPGSLGGRIGDGSPPDGVGVDVAGDAPAGEIGESQLTGAGVAAQVGEGVVDRDLPAFGQDALGLFDDDAGGQDGQGGLELDAFEVALFQGSLLQDGDGGDVRQGLGRQPTPGVWCLVWRVRR